MSIFASVPKAPADPILGLVARFKADPAEKKVNLSVGAYRSEEGKPWILPSVAEAEKLVVSDTTQDKEYQPIDGKQEYKRAVQELIFSKDVIDSGSVVTIQALSGTGSLQCIAQFLKFMGVTKVWCPNPTWGNHPKIFQRALLECDTYPYWHQEKRGLDFEGMMAGIQKMQEGECILLHAVAHNPTGVDPTNEQWQKIVAACKERKLIPLLDNAYQGYASGQLAKDGYSQQLFTESGMEFFIAQSFAKKLRTVRRAHWLHSCTMCFERCSRCRVVADEDHRASGLFEPSQAWCFHCEQGLDDSCPERDVVEGADLHVESHQ